MTIRNLQFLFKHVDRPDRREQAARLGRRAGRPQPVPSGFDGPVMPVNPKHGAIERVLTCADVESLPLVPDLAVTVAS